MFSSATLLALVGAVSGSVIWDGRANDYADSSFLDKWSFSNPVGPYQWYIHGSGATNTYVNLGDYKNPADTGSKQGIQITNDKTSVWNGQTMLRTELIPETDAAINKGKVYYHFSMQHTGTNPPSPLEEHQINFFESHFTEMKYGLMSGASGTSSNKLGWYVGGTSQWEVELEPDVWHNIAYGIDFDAGTVEYYHSTGADALVKTAGPIDAETSSNGADWHLGVLRLTEGPKEDWHFSGVYIEDGTLTTSVVSPGGAAADAAAPASSASSAAPAPASSSAAPPTSTQAPTTFSTLVKPTSSAAPVSSSAAPVYSSSAPVSSSAAPVSSSAPPAPSSAPPAYSSAAPVPSAAAPSCKIEYVYV